MSTAQTRTGATTFKQPKRQIENEEDAGLPLRPGQHADPKFVYVHYPMGWDFCDDGQVLVGFEKVKDENGRDTGAELPLLEQFTGFLPKLSKINAIPGVNGVDDHGSMASPIAAAVDRKGGTYIPPKDNRLGIFKGYCAYYDVKGGGKHFVDAGVEIKVLRNGVWLDNGNKTAPWWNGFRKQILDSGMVEPMMVEVFDREISLAEQLAEKLEDLSADGANKGMAARAERERGRVERMRTAWAAMNQAEEAQPVTKHDDDSAAAAPQKQPRRKTAEASQ